MGFELRKLPDLLYSCQEISFRNQLNLNQDLNGTELRKLPDLFYSCRHRFPSKINWIRIRIWMELSSGIFQISSTAAEIDSLWKSIEFEIGFAWNWAPAFPDLLYTLKEISLGSCREDLEASWAQFHSIRYSNLIDFSRKSVSAAVDEIWRKSV